jgi:hypothetical protein
MMILLQELPEKTWSEEDLTSCGKDKGKGNADENCTH